ncbi:venom protease isoform X1 [Acyrthosiphon pisum]|uniref:Peptidase S1 domain-containing protein n=2 Tax=Acyrthosiphon pisum TaxID=7029 RepID=A0A8R1W4M9_ACYPI|nr:venom protease isoform X1 [Acyrthosiphon pisum]|eukprot:XP_003240507.1 PREDICTED: venom protease-like [Acyrthosiphon pisum]
MYFKIKYCLIYFKILLALIQCLSISGHITNMLDLYEGDVCQVGKENSRNHVCKQPENCASLEQRLRDQDFPHVCSFIKNKPIVCCSPTVTINTTNFEPVLKTPISTSSYSATEMCSQYKDLVYANVQQPSSGGIQPKKTPKCYNVMTLIVGGMKAKPMEFPHMALLGYGNIEDEEKSWGCGGSLISNRWILSAAHCTINPGRTVSWARLGVLNIYSLQSDDPGPADYKVVERVVHPKYNSTYVYNDIALFRLEVEVKFSEHVRPVCLNTVQNLSFDMTTATGWGRTSTNGMISPDLLKVDLSLISNENCKYSYPQSANPRINFGILEDSMICAGDIVDGGDTCTGDSGGPLQIKHPDYICMSSQIGITSFGKYCGNRYSPGVFTRVSKYVPWIEQIVWPKS